MAGSNWGSINSGGYDEKVRLNDLVEVVDTTKLKKYKPFRPIGPVFTYRMVWCPIFKDGKQVIKSDGRPLQIPKMITNYDGEKQTYTDEVCPYQQLMEKANKLLPKESQMYESPNFLTCVINRTLQDELPEDIKPPTKSETKNGFRDIESKHRNPVQVLYLNSSHSFKKIKDTMELNTVKLKSGDKVVKEPSDPKYGYDIQIKFDPDNKVKADKFQVQKAERTPLTEDELEYLLWDIQGAINAMVEKPADAKKEADRLWAEIEKSKSKSSKSSDDEDSEEPEDLEDDEEKKPVKKVLKKPTRKQEEEDDEEQDEEEETKPAKKPVKKVAKKRDDEEEEDDEEEVKPSKKPVKKPVKKAKDEEEDDEDLIGLEDDEEEDED